MSLQDLLPDSGLIRKMWIGEAARYRNHLLRLDTESRGRRFRRRRFGRLYPQLRHALDVARCRRARLLRKWDAAGSRRTTPDRRPSSKQAEAAFSVERTGKVTA